MLSDKTVGVIGVGKMGEALIQGLLKAGKVTRERVIGTVQHEASRERVRERLGIELAADNAALARAADVVILCVKPQGADAVLQDIGAVLVPPRLLISVVASVSTEFIAQRIDAPVPIVRAMSNTPALIGQAMSVVAPGRHAGSADLELAREIFGGVGRTAVIEERFLDAVTGLSGSGPAYVYVVIESLAEAGVKLGIPRETSTLLAAQTVLGAAQMVLETREHPALLKDVVTTPAGCTIDGLLELEEGRLRVTLIKAVVKAAERAHELVRSQGA